jgi:MFS family permease
VSNLGNAGIGLSLYGLTSYVPLFAQSVRGESATGASAVLTPFMVGWSLMALVSGRLYLRIGFRNAGLLGTSLAAAGTLPLALLARDTPLIVPSVAMGLTGVGLGVISPAFLLAPQSAVPWRLRGAVTSSIQFSRTIAGSMGVALLGAVLNARLGAAAATLAAQAGMPAEDLTSAMLNPATRTSIPPETLAALVAAMADGLHRIYVALAILATLAVLQVVLFARDPGRDAEGTGSAPSDRPLETAAGLA